MSKHRLGRRRDDLEAGDESSKLETKKKHGGHGLWTARTALEPHGIAIGPPSSRLCCLHQQVI